MRKLSQICSAAAISLGLCFTASSVFSAENRCGWYSFPTPQNLMLIDKDATWSITSQGQANGPDADGAENAPDFDSKQFVATNVPGAGYGYGCACMDVETSAADKRITRVISGKILPLADCKKDKALPAPE